MAQSWPHIGAKQPSTSETDDRYQGEESYGDPELITTGVMDDLKAIGVKGARADIKTLLDVAMAKGKPVDDRQMTASEAFLFFNVLTTLTRVVDGKIDCNHCITPRNIKNQAQALVYDC